LLNFAFAYAYDMCAAREPSQFWIESILRLGSLQTSAQVGLRRVWILSTPKHRSMHLEASIHAQWTGIRGYAQGNPLRPDPEALTSTDLYMLGTLSGLRWFLDVGGWRLGIGQYLQSPYLRWGTWHGYGRVFVGFKGFR